WGGTDKCLVVMGVHAFVPRIEVAVPGMVVSGVTRTLARESLVHQMLSRDCGTVGVCVWSFFFASRRRHTRLVSDWSSDVCSSDLSSPALVAILTGLPAGLELDRDAIDADLKRRQEGYGRSPRQQIEQDRVEVLAGLRSEERRVGKEGRSRWWPCDGIERREN